MQGQRLNSSKPQRDKSRAMMEKCAMLFGFVLGGNMMFQMLGLLWPHLFFLCVHLQDHTKEVWLQFRPLF